MKWGGEEEEDVFYDLRSCHLNSLHTKLRPNSEVAIGANPTVPNGLARSVGEMMTGKVISLSRVVFCTERLLMRPRKNEAKRDREELSGEHTMGVTAFVSASRQKRSPKRSPKFRLDRSFTKVEHFAVNYAALYMKKNLLILATEQSRFYEP